jgi:uncharacterized protein
MGRVVRFYEIVSGFSLSRNKPGLLEMAWFPGVQNSIGSGNSLVYEPNSYQPSSEGTLLYFTAFSGDVAIEQSRVEAAGDKVLMPRTLITPEIG